MYVDLTHVIKNGMPSHPFDIPVVLKPIVTYEKDGVASHYLHASVHTGTHIDAHGAPARCIAVIK